MESENNTAGVATTGSKELSGKEAKKARRAEKTAQKAGDPGAAGAATSLSLDSSSGSSSSLPINISSSSSSSIPVRAPRPPSQNQQQQRGGANNTPSVSSSASSEAAISSALASERLSARTAWHAYFPRCGSNTAPPPPLLHAIFKADAALGTFSSPMSGSSKKALALLEASRAFAMAFTAADGTSFPRELYKALQLQFSALAVAVTGASSNSLNVSNFYNPSDLVILRAIRSFVTRLNPAMDAESSRIAFSASIDSFVSKRLNVVSPILDSIRSLSLFSNHDQTKQKNMTSSSSSSSSTSTPALTSSSTFINSSKPVIALFASTDSNLTEDALIQLLKGADHIDELSLVIIDSRPLLAGRNTLLKIKEAVGVNAPQMITEKGETVNLIQRQGGLGVLTVTYTFLSGFDHLLRKGRGELRRTNSSSSSETNNIVDLLLIPVASVLGDGRVLASSGAAAAAALAHRAGVPVYAVAESYKFASEKIALDSLSINSVGSPSLVLSSRPKGAVASQPQGKIKAVEGKDPLAGISIPFEDEGVFNHLPSPITASPSLCVLPLLFDLSAKEQISGFVTERGLVVGKTALTEFFNKLLKEQEEDEQGDTDEKEEEEEEEDDDDDDDDDVEGGEGNEQDEKD